MKQRSFSVVGLLAIAAVLGVAMGAVLGSRAPDEVDEASFAHAESFAEKMFPMGEAEQPRRGGLITAHPESLRGIPPYPGAAPRRISDVTSVMGMPMVVSWFTTPDSVDQVMNHYGATWADAGVPIVAHRFGPRLGYVAWLEEETVDDGGVLEGIMHMVSVIKNTEHSTETTVLLSASRPQRVLDGTKKLPPGLALPTGADAPRMVEMALEGRTRRIVTTRRRGALGETTDEVVGLLKKDGWAVEEVMGADTVRSLIARKGAISQAVSATAVDGKRGPEVALMYTVEQDKVTP